MSASTAASPIQIPFTRAEFARFSVPVQKLYINHSSIMDVSKRLVYVGTVAALAGLFTSIGPLGGAIFAVSAQVTGRAVWLCSKGKCCPNSEIAKFAIRTLACIGAGYAVLTLAGFPVTITSAVVLHVGSIFLGAGVLYAGVEMIAPFVPQNDNSGRRLQFRSV